MTCGCEPVLPHKYPVLTRPVSRASFIREVQRACRKAKLNGKPTVLFPADLDEEHARNARRYAQVIPSMMQFEFAEATLCLPKRYRDALIAHEIGHVLDPHGTEDDADVAAHRAFGKRIKYDKRWPGKGLQSNPMRRAGPLVLELTEGQYARQKSLATGRLPLDPDLQHIGQGGDRIVFAFKVGDREPFAFKADQGTNPDRQTEAEVECLRYTSSPLAPKIFDWDRENYRWIEMELLNPSVDEDDFKRITGIEWDDFGAAFDSSGVRPGFYLTDEMREAIWEDSKARRSRKGTRFMTMLLDFADECEIASNEFGNADNWAMTLDGKMVKPVDLGH